MFKQITDLSGNEWYLIVSLWIFLVFFIAVGVYLFRMRKDYVDYMKDMPMDDEATEQAELKN